MEDLKPRLLGKRLESLDILRGFDLFLLLVLCPLLWKLQTPVRADWFDAVLEQFDHVRWEGFAFWDLVMPLFMFMSGVTIPFALAKYRGPGHSSREVYSRILKRFVLLWLLGMVVQGNLLSLQPAQFKVFSNTLQAIAVGYLFSSLIFLHFRPFVRYGIAIALLLGYWALMVFVGTDGYGKGDFSPENNLAAWIDRAVLGVYRDGAGRNDAGMVVFSSGYTYTWILSSMNFVVTVLTGVFAGEFLKRGRASDTRKALYLFLWGTGMAAAGWLWGMQMPVVKRIWTGSMVLVSSGYCFWLLSLFYYWIDCRGYGKGLGWLKIFGMNSIVAYVLGETVNFRCIGASLLYGLEKYIGGWYPFVIELSNAGVLMLILLYLYRNRKFLRV